MKQGVSYRAEIDGLRAWSVLAVVIYHAFPAVLKGGFVGVDVFFVISGYLITSIILRQRDSGKFSLVNFYARRVRRLYPALLVVTLITLFFSWLWLFPDELSLAVKHAFASQFFVINFVLAGEGGYFDLSTDLKPFLHYWSLAVEEQFYLVYPLLLISIGVTSGSRIKWSLVGVIVISFITSVYYSRFEGGGYFLPWVRAFELLAGCLLAACSKEGQAGGCKWCANFALLALVICFFAIERGHFPGWIAALPVIFTLLVLRYGISGNQWLAHPSLVWIGKLSYPLYLWHWPCLVLLPLVFGQGYVVLLSALIASLCLSYVTYRFVEQPFSYGELNRVVPVLLLVSVVIALCLGGVLMQDKRFLYTVSPNSDAVNLALPLKSESQCQDDAPVENLIFCRRNRELEGVRIALLGDSFSNQYYDGLGEVLLGHDIGLLNFGAPGCAALLEVNSIQTHKDCSASVDALRFAADSDAIDVVVLAGAWYTIKKYRENPAHLANLIDDTLNFLEARGKTVIFVHTLPVHRQKIRKNCVSRSVWQEQPECVVLRSEVDRWRDIVRPDIDKVLARHPGVQIFDPTPFLCDENVCDIRRNGRLLYRDAHLSAYGGEYLGQFLATLIVKSTEVRK